MVSAARIQELPDANAAESVSRLPGVSLIRTGGEGSRVVIRGLSPQYNRITIDGVELPANVVSNDPNEHKSEFRASDQLSFAGDRATDLSMISSNMLGGIEVIKAITPDMDATVLGGVVNFDMRKAVANNSKMPQFEVIMQGSHNALKDTYEDYKLVTSGEKRFLDNHIGLFVQAFQERKNLSANELQVNYNFAGKLYLTDEGAADFQSMNLSDVLRNRDRFGATVVLDWNHATGSIGLMNFLSKSNTHSIYRNETYVLLDNDLFYSATNSKTLLDVYSHLLSIKQTVLGFDIDAKFSHSYSRTKNPEDVRFNFWQNDAGFTNLYNSLKYAKPEKIAAIVKHTPENAVFFDIYNVGNISKDKTINGAIDFQTNLNFSKQFTSKLKFGGSYQYRDRFYDYNQSSGSVFYDDGGQVSAAIALAFPQFTSDGTGITFQDFIDSHYKYNEFLNGKYVLGPPMNVDLMLQAIEVAKRNPGTGNGGGYKPHKLSSLLYDYSGFERREAAYTMATFNIGQKLSIIPGIRYQNLTTTYKGIRGEAIPNGIQYTRSKETVSHPYYLPMGHLRFRPFNWMTFHFAYTNTLNYPDYSTIVPTYYIGTNFIRYNNYKLKPATSENFDAVLAFHSNEIGLFSIGGYKKRIENLIFPTKTNPSDFSAYPELYEKMKNRKERYSLFTYINNPIPVDIWGMETEYQSNFYFLPGPLSGLVLNINYSHIFSEAKYPKTFLISYLDSNYVQQTVAIDTFYTSRLLNQPNDIMNIAVGYDYRGFSARFSMLYIDNIFKNPDFWLQNRINSAKYVRFDFSAKQKLPWLGMQIYFNLNNLLGEDDIDINQKTKFIAKQQRYGMTADVGIRFKL